MKTLIKVSWKYFWQCMGMLMILMMSLPAWADNFPISVPTKDQASSSADWMDTWGPRFGSVLEMIAIGLGSALLASAAMGMVKAYHKAHEKEDLSIFFKGMIIALILSAVGIALLYVAYTAAAGLNTTTG